MGGVVSLFQNIFVFSWDAILAIINLVTPRLKSGHVVPKGCPGERGKWPEYIAPKEGDSRCACPALNALANHGILPRNGRNITFKEMNRACNTVYNFAGSFTYFVPNYAANMLKKKYSKDVFDLEEISLHNGIEHDASLCRQDVYFNKDQGKPHLPYINELLASASGKTADGTPLLTLDDLARYSAKRRVESKASNPEFSLAFIHKMFGSSNSSTLLTIFGGHVPSIRTMLVEERIPDGWESCIKDRKGLTFAKFNLTVFKVESGTQKYVKALEEKKND
ncbi:Cloroperoxidase [Dendrothele bispora CBS 962.96]|uniref:Cloroperoxidase n=1 Tax=Dendrothele bispora (strain CBS 962.96) TaxID=1314807 RepID=A0A4S8MJB1_DENBC|nr:Cloroperoxidase [Dendrothele bispora CBS 962.96]